jgi:uncharacterized membrane protein YidH (DUF202 family)
MVLPLIVGLPIIRTPLPLILTSVVLSNVQFEPVMVRDVNRGNKKPVVTVLGLTVIAQGGVGTTVNASAQMMAVDPVAPPVTVTLQVPPAAASVTVMLATTVVALLAVALFTVTPAQPKLTATLSIALALTPVSVIVTSPVNPASTDAGLTLAHPGSSVFTSNLPVHTNISAPVVTVTSQVASTASAAMVILAVISVALLAVALFTVMPVQLKATAEVGPKLVRSALITTSKVVSFTPNVGSTLTQPGPTPLQTVTDEVRVVSAVSLLALSLATISST